MGNLSRASDTEKEFPVPYLFECFSVDFVKGELKWLSRPMSHFKTDMAFNTVNSRQSGKPVGSIASNGYAVVGLRGTGAKRKVLYQHRIISAMYYGEWPDENIDHFDGDTGNNNISNLRPASQASNCKNSKMKSTNSSGVSGVRWYPRYQAWHAQGTHDYKSFHLGYHSDLFSAICARKSWEEGRGFSERHGKELTCTK